MSKEQQESLPELTAEQWGTKLSSCREARGISQEQVASDLNLPNEYIVELERGGLSALPSMVFARGYIRAYAKLLDLDDNELVSEYEQIHGEGGFKGQIKPVSRVRQQVKMGHPVVKLFTWVFILGIVGLSVWWWQTQSQVNLGRDTTKPVPQTSEAQSGSLVESSGDLKLPEIVEEDEELSAEPAESVTESEEPVDLSPEEIAKIQKELDSGQAPQQIEENIETESEASAETEAIVEESFLGTDEVSVAIDFSRDCWVTVKDGTGKTLFNNIRGKGQSLNLTGKAPISLLMGNATAIERFSFNGQEMDLTEYNRKNIIRLTLPLAE